MQAAKTQLYSMNSIALARTSSQVEAKCTRNLALSSSIHINVTVVASYPLRHGNSRDINSRWAAFAARKKGGGAGLGRCGLAAERLSLFQHVTTGAGAEWRSSEHFTAGQSCFSSHMELFSSLPARDSRLLTDSESAPLQTAKGAYLKGA